MERQKYLAVMIWMTWLSISVSAQTSFQSRIYQAFIVGDMEQWRAILTEYADQNPSDEKQQLELVDYYYGYTAWLIGNDRRSEAKENISKAGKLIETILEKTPENATALAFKGAFVGFQIGVNLIKAPFLGPKSIKYIEQALTIDPDNIQATIENANALYYRPAIFGGDKKLAIEFYEKAVSLMEAQNRTQNNWNYLNLLTVLAQAYDETGSLAEARTTYEKILQHEPHYSWVRDELYPAFMEKFQSTLTK